ncbi:MAG: DUF2470 domain-containing protein [Cellulomonas sp.]|nr:DUF2470 domain-containing protein [Rickettsiella sp.]
MSEKKIALEALRFMHQMSYGTLATQSVAVAGYPFGSLVTYCFDYENKPILQLSNIAQHTKNIQADSRVSLTVVLPQIDIQASPRITYLGDAHLVESRAIEERYYRYFPEARTYHEMHDFKFYRIETKKIRLITTFGKIYWVNISAFNKINPFSADEINIVNHMNQSHSQALQTYCAKASIAAENKVITLVGFDSTGMHLRVEHALHYIPFLSSLKTIAELKSYLINLAAGTYA